jgi:peptide/nickel transport system permease protein
LSWLRGNRSLQIGLLVFAPFLFCALLPGLVAPHGPNELLAAPLENPSWHYLLGTDEVGRDLLSRLIYAARADILISLSSALIAAVLGSTIGLLAGYAGGIFDPIAMRSAEVMLSFPSILLALFLITVLGRSTWILIFALSVLFVPSFMRLGRALALTIRDRAYVEASAIAGGRPLHILRMHLIPNAAGPLLVGTALTAAYALVAAATLSYLGLGTQPPSPSWGNMLQTSFEWRFKTPWYGVLPGVCITLVAFAYTWISDGIQEAIGLGGRPARSLRAWARSFDADPPSEASAAEV